MHGNMNVKFIMTHHSHCVSATDGFRRRSSQALNIVTYVQGRI